MKRQYPGGNEHGSRYLTKDERLVPTGREKDLIVRSGHNIDPAPIEDVANDFPGVQISSAVGMPDQYAGRSRFCSSWLRPDSQSM